MLSQLSARHVGQLLTCLRDSYKLACDFDLRPGLKFLMQKVAHTPVAVNLYKQAGASMVFYIHTLIKICCTLPELDKAKVCEILNQDSKDEDKDDEPRPATVDTAGNNTNAVDKVNDNVENNANVDDIAEKLENAIDDSETLPKSEEGETIPSEIHQSSKTMCTKNLPDEKGDYVSKTKQDAVDNHPENTLLNPLGPKITDNTELYIQQLRSVCDELCETYLDILYDTAGTSCVDNMANQQLFFLIAQPDEFPEIQSARVDVKQLNETLEKTQARFQGQTALPLQAVSVQQGETDVTIWKFFS